MAGAESRGPKPYITRMPYDSEMAQQALDGYSETLRRAVAATLLKPRNPIPLEELSERILTALANPPVVDRRIRDLPADARATLAILGLFYVLKWIPPVPLSLQYAGVFHRVTREDGGVGSEDVL